MRQTPSLVIVSFRSGNNQLMTTSNTLMGLTLQEASSEVDAKVAIPRPFALVFDY